MCNKIGHNTRKKKRPYTYQYSNRTVPLSTLPTWGRLLLYYCIATEGCSDVIQQEKHRRRGPTTKKKRCVSGGVQCQRHLSVPPTPKYKRALFFLGKAGDRKDGETPCATTIQSVRTILRLSYGMRRNTRCETVTGSYSRKGVSRSGERRQDTHTYTVLGRLDITLPTAEKSGPHVVGNTKSIHTRRRPQ